MRYLAPLCLALLSAAPNAQVVTNLWPGTLGAFTQRALDIVILGDGYTAAEQNTFNANAAQLATTITSAYGSSTQFHPFSQYRFKFRVWSIFAASAQSGVDIPVAGLGAGLQVRDTRYNCSYNAFGVARAVLPANGAVGSNGPVHAISGLNTAIADANLIAPLVPPQLPSVPSRIFIVLVNQPNAYGGASILASTGAVYCAGYNGTVPGANPPVGLQVQLHELGHALGQLEDEYHDESSATTLTYTGTPPIVFGFNVTTNPSAPAWAPWVPTIGAPRPGGLGFDLGIWHPSPNSLMNRLYQNGNSGSFVAGQPLGTAQVFDVVGQEQLIRRISVMSDTYQNYAPVQTAPVVLSQGALQSFSLNVLVGSPHLYQWRVNGAVVQSGLTPVFTLNSATLAVGQYFVDCVATDQNPSIRTPAGGFVNPPSRAWRVVVNPPAPDLGFVAGSISAATSTNVGAGLPLNATITNTGTAAASSYMIEYFLAAAPTGISIANDILLARDAQSGLGVNGSYFSGLVPTVPFHVAPGTYYLGVWVDRGGVTGDSNPADNSFVWPTPIFINAPLGCPTVLEIAEPLGLGPTQSVISATAGATLPLVLTAPCQVGATYVLSASVTGTSPGIPVGGFTLPLVFDFATQLVIDNINLPPFIAFTGTVGPSGQIRASFTPPPGYLSPGNFQIWFAGTLITSGVVSGVTNPVQVRVNT